MRIRNFFILLSFIFLFYLWNFRGYYIPTFDADYMNDYYDHSQWVVPQSVRVMGDEARYEVAAYRLMHGGDLYEVAPEVPSVGKYLFGISQLLFGRSIVVIALVFVVTVYGFYLLTGQFFEDQRKRQIATLLFILTPNVVLSLQRVTLDLMQICALIFHIYFLLRAIQSENKKAWVLFVVSGLFSGLFVSIKFGLFVIPVLITDGILLYLQRKLRFLLVISMMAGVVYVLSTLAFFGGGGDLTGWVQAQKWVAKFYLTSNTGFVPGMALVTMLTSLYKGWWGQGWELSEDWSVVMTGGFVVMLFFVYRLAKNRKMPEASWIFALIYSAVTIVMLCGIAFWPRYLLLLTPFFVLFIVKFLFEHRIIKVLALVFFVAVLLQTFLIFSPQPTRAISGFQANFRDGLFQDLYFQLSSSSRPKGDEIFFWKKLITVQDQLVVYTRDVTVKERVVWPWENRIVLPMRITYLTDIGTSENETTLYLRREHDKWMIDWQWGYVLPEYVDGAEIEKTRIDAQEGQLLLTSGKVVSNGGRRVFVYVIPQEVANYEKLEYLIAPVINESRYYVSKKIKENSPADRWVGLGFVWPGNNASEVCADQAVRCITMPGRQIIEEFIKKGQVEEVMKIERKYSERLQARHGGSVILHLPDGTRREIYSGTARDGEDVVISESDILKL